MADKGKTWAQLQATHLGDMLKAMGLRKGHDKYCEAEYIVSPTLQPAWGLCSCEWRKANAPRIRVRKQLNSALDYYNMWEGWCSKCKYKWQFWFFGATLGHGLEHQRRCR